MNQNITKLYNDIKNHPLEYITLILAIFGATFASGSDDVLRGWGFLLWVFSNGWMLIGFIRYKNIPYTVLFIYYEITNINGIYNNWINI